MARLRNTSFLAALVMLAAVSFTLGCGESKPATSDASSRFQPADVGSGSSSVKPAAFAQVDEPDEAGREGSASSKKPAPISVDKLDAESLPDGPPDAILAFMRKLDGYEPRGVTRDAQRADLVRVLRLMMEAGDLLLAHPQASGEQRKEGAAIKMNAINTLAQLGDPKADQEMIAFCTRLKKDKSAALAHMGRAMLFGIDVAKFQNGDIDDPQPLLRELGALAEGEDEEHLVFMLGLQAATTFVQLGHNTAAADAFKLLGERYQNDESPQIAEQAKQLLKQVKLVELDLRGKLDAVVSDKPQPKAAEELVAAIKDLLEDDDRAEIELSVAGMAATRLEQFEYYDAAQQIVDLIEAQFSTHANDEVAQDAKNTIESSRKRLGLIGAKLEITGNTLDGQPVNTASLQGKVVLIDFWATWCLPCLEEIPNIKRYYEEYRDQGFEVVGYNLDDKREDLDRFFAKQKLPWATVVSEDADRTGFESPLAEACGVQAIPFLVLLDREGKVVALHARGERLGEKLAELLGTAE